MTGGSDGIEMDTEALIRAAGDLGQAGARLTALSSRAGAVGVSADAFGSMNSYLGGPIQDAAGLTTQLLKASGDVVAALGAGARAAAADWAEYEEGTAQGFTEARADLEAARDIL